MQGTQCYKKHLTVTFPREGFDLVRQLVAEQLDSVAAVMDDPGAEEYFTKGEWCAMGFQRLMLAQMLARMEREARQ